MTKDKSQKHIKSSLHMSGEYHLTDEKRNKQRKSFFWEHIPFEIRPKKKGGKRKHLQKVKMYQPK